MELTRKKLQDIVNEAVEVAKGTNPLRREGETVGPIAAVIVARALEVFSPKNVLEALLGE